MDERVIMELMTNCIYATLIVSAPMIMISLVIGVFVSIIQTAFSIQEQTLSFVPKIIAMSAALIFFGNWMLRFMVEYSRDIFINLVKYVLG